MVDTAENTFQFELVSPEAVLSSEPASMVVIPGEDGDFGVLAGHAALLSSLRPGVVKIHNDNSETREVFVAGGFAEVKDNLCTVLAEEAVELAKLDKAEIEKTITDLNEDIGFAGDDAQKKKRIEKRLLIEKAKLAAVTGEIVL